MSENECVDMFKKCTEGT